ncbi:MAG TPA: ribonuclease PH [Syntrophorhabdaceae bacterium]|nr:ribonuclease PH [Syntrophorhabdaceae bacterium]HOL06095.1 ribonuclease PH [Syntrophorhabdaceae bacterium]HON85914.1 ribonuclease PH [Syntrophorhabdaceae bacterium]HOT42321.1 ribonuclease PH [Syntrophorhabdaceae bacterium]HPC67441.1 ribonuclease PH [Syntrophorhabdaceae bacterium]
MRDSGRQNDRIRDLKISRGFLKYPEGSVLVEMGETKVICGVSIEEKVPPFLKNTGKGWLTAEYSMLPRSTHTRSVRESVTGRVGGRTHEIQRLIGRALRAIVNLDIIGERTLWIDCDVIQADGGTRTASITGGYVALVEALWTMKKKGMIEKIPLRDSVAAISVGLVGGDILLDLSYEEDSRAEVDMNFVMTGRGLLIEVQGTAEKTPFTKEHFDLMYQYACKGINEITRQQKIALGNLFPM